MQTVPLSNAVENRHGRCCHRRTTRSGLTVIELVVVMAVIGLLASLVGAAVMGARETARRMECSSHLRQIGLAVQEYHSTHDRLPCSGLLGFRYIAELVDGRAGNWGVYGSPDPCMFGPCPEVGEWHRPPVYLCPSDPVVRRTRRSMSYAFSSGVSVIPGAAAGISDGIGFGDVDPAKLISFRDVGDGLSNTACASEQLISLAHAASSDIEYLAAFDDSLAATHPLRYIWTFTGTYTLPADLPGLFRECDAATTDTMPHFAGNPYNVRMAAYDHVRTPNLRACFNPLPSVTFLSGAIIPPTSLHRSGVNLLLCDGSVRFVSNSIDSGVWRSVGTRNGAEAPSDF